MYIDEVGNPDFKSSGNPNHRYLALTGIIIDLNYVKETIHPQLESLKKEYFDYHPDEPIIFHRKEMVNCRPPFERLKNDETRVKFDQELLNLFSQWEYEVITICLDKKNHFDTYQVWRYDPYHYCLALLLERYALYLKSIGANGDVLAESRGGKEDRRLKESFLRLWKEGTEFITPEIFQKVLTSKQLKVKPKINNIAGLQIADLLAHPSRNEILKENGQIDKELAPFAKKIIEIIGKKSVVSG